MYFERFLQKKLAASNKSCLLLGPRQTGKSTLIRALKPDLEINLAHEQTFLDFVSNPSELENRLKGQKYRTIFIDEVQRLPSLLNTLQTLMDSDPSKKFFLTGSSARKLRRGRANLLPGRIHTYYLGPLCAAELDYELNTHQGLETGILPGIYTETQESSRQKTLRSYSLTYLKEEIQAEALTRNLEGFSRFIFVVAQWSGHFLDLAKLAKEAQIPRQTAVRYFEILEDTLIVNRCLPFAKNTRKRLIQHPKYYFFDTGVLNALLHNFKVSSDRKGNIFEHLFFNQLLAGAFAHDKEIQIYTYRTEHGAEVDFIVEYDNELWAIELKASAQVNSGDLRGLRNFKEFLGKEHHAAIAYFGPHEKQMEHVILSPWQTLLKKMGL